MQRRQIPPKPDPADSADPVQKLLQGMVSQRPAPPAPKKVQRKGPPSKPGSKPPMDDKPC